MRLIDTSYFTMAPHVIANAAAAPSSSQEKAACKVISDIIDRYHDTFVIGVSGGQAACLLESLERAQVMEDLDEAAREAAEALREPFGCFIHFHILRNSQGTSGVEGVFTLVTTDARVSPRVLQTQLWNEMARSLRVLSARFGWEPDPNLLSYVNPLNI